MYHPQRGIVLKTRLTEKSAVPPSIAPKQRSIVLDPSAEFSLLSQHSFREGSWMFDACSLMTFCVNPRKTNLVSYADETWCSPLGGILCRLSKAINVIESNT